MAIRADTPVQYIKGVGPRRGDMLRKAGVETVEDLLRYLPFRYEDRTNFVSIQDLVQDQEAVVEAQVVTAGILTTPIKRVRIFQMVVRDSSASLAVKFFNQAYLEKVFKKGQTVVLYGAPKYDDYQFGLCLLNPEFELVGSDESLAIHTGRVVPVYRKVGKILTRYVRQIVFQVLEDLTADDLEEHLPPSVVRRYGFPSRFEALRQVHFPILPEGEDAKRFLADLDAKRTPAQQRLIFEEFFFFQLGLKVVKKKRELVPKDRSIKVKPRTREVIKSILPFHPTGAQKRVLKEIVDDLVSPNVMSRLLQGDVGSGKTIVAVQAMIVVMENSYQAVLMAPTEILAEQHFQAVSDLLASTDYQIALLSGRIKGKERKETLKRIVEGQTHLVVGTHAVFQKGVKFKDLGLVVIDEQHRFGVLQRSQLMEKGGRPDTLVMTATPIPRSLAMTLYGDLDLSIIDEIPPGRQPVVTVIKPEVKRGEVYLKVRKELAQGRQAFIVYPLVEKSEKVDLRAATEMAVRLQEEVFSEYQVGLIHGRLKPEEKEALMTDFVAGRIEVLVSTTVIEVGIDVPNASVMVVEHADRFGLSQLHQLRGRIGRGPYQSYCILMTEGPRSQDAFERLGVMSQTSDGFKIAEKDLEIRGPGDFVGTRQSGFPSFYFGNIVRDRKWLLLAETEAIEHLRRISQGSTDLESQLAALGEEWRERFGLYEVG